MLSQPGGSHSNRISHKTMGSYQFQTYALNAVVSFLRTPGLAALYFSFPSRKTSREGKCGLVEEEDQASARLGEK